MSEKRRDNKGRILHSGEFQMKDGRYRYKYFDSLGKEKVVYSWKLERTDKIPIDKKCSASLREMEEKIRKDLQDHIASNGGNTTVLELVEKYLSMKTGVKITTKAGYGVVVSGLKKDPFSAKRIDTIRISDAKCWIIKLHKDGKRYSTIHTIRGVLRPAFQMAVDDDLIRKNPFDFHLSDVIADDSVTREAVTKEEEQKFLDFVKEDEHYCRYYEGMYILFNTGMRISEFCGLTIRDIDFEEHCIRIERQLQKRGSEGYYIETTKTTCGTRVIPMTPDVEECFRTIIRKRRPPKIDPSVEGHRGFLYFDKDGSICYALHWQHYFRHVLEKYNRMHKVQLPKITPHICRHTYCSNMAKSGMNPKTLQYLMGHADISVTLNVYTHVKYEDAKEEVYRLAKVV